MATATPAYAPGVFADTVVSRAAGPDPATCVIVGALVVLVIVAAYYLWRRARGPKGPQKGLGQALADAGWVVVLRDGCGWCTKQLAVLGGAYPRYVECAKGGPAYHGVSAAEKAKLPACGTVGTPYWANVKTGQKAPGYQDAAKLHALLAPPVAA